MLIFTVFLVICFGLVCYTDFRWLVIPDAVNLALFAGGLIYRAQQGLISTATALAFGVLIATAMWIIRYGHYRLKNEIGLGLGDVKLTGAAAVWISPWSFPAYLFLASSLALLVLIVAKGLGRATRATRMPFGPFLAGSLVVTWVIEQFLGPLIGTNL